MSTATKTPVRRRTPTFDVDDVIFNLVRSTGTESDWAAADLLPAASATAKAPPASVDLRAAWWEVGNQGHTGSCVGWATADGVGRQVLAKAGRITATQRLSPRYVWMGSKETDEFVSRPTGFIEGSGTSLKSAVEIAQKFGFALESDLPFAIDTVMFTGSENAFYASAAKRRVSYANLRNDLDGWKRWLAASGPILAGLSADASFTGVGSDGKVGTFDASTVRGGHAVAIVGYRTDGRFIVRNSWGTGWGDHGFGYVDPAYIAAAFFPESYGLVPA